MPCWEPAASGAPSHRPARAVRPHLFSPLLCLFVCWKSAGRGCELFLFLCGKGRDCWDFKVVCRGRVLGGLRGMRRGIFLFLFFSISPAAAARRLNIQRFCSCGERTRRSSEELHEPPCLSLVVRVYIFDFHFFPHGPATYGHLFLLWHSVCVCVLKMRSLLLRPTSNLCSLEEMEQERINREATRHPAPRRDADLHLLFLFPSLFALLRAT